MKNKRGRPLEKVIEPIPATFDEVLGVIARGKKQTRTERKRLKAKKK